MSKEKIYQSLGLASFQLSIWFRKLCLFQNFVKNEYPKNLFNIITVRRTPYNTRDIITFLSLQT